MGKRTRLNASCLGPEAGLAASGTLAVLLFWSCGQTDQLADYFPPRGRRS